VRFFLKKINVLYVQIVLLAVLQTSIMILSMNAFRDDFEVSCPELDQLVESALKVRPIYITVESYDIPSIKKLNGL
jgi:hypothetical protein